MATDNYSDPYVMEDSDQEGGNDSEDEISQWLDGTPRQKNAIRRRSIGLPSDSSEDEFEKEMMSELDGTMTKSFPLSQQALKSKKQQEEETNDALFYDPSMDDDDEAWVKRQRASYRPPAGKSGDSPAKTVGAKTKDVKSDAVLNCPACMCAVCLDCQRHDIYQDQYRAMFTLNTMVNYGETLQFKKKPQKSSKKNKRKRKHNSEPEPDTPTASSDYRDMETMDQESAKQAEERDCYHPVTCSNCNTRVAVYDSEEVFHFFNVIASYS